MEIIDNINQLLGDNLKNAIRPESKLKIAASCFSIYAYESLKTEFQQIDSLQFLFTSPTFVANQVSDKLKKEKREFYIPKIQRESSLYGTEFEIRLKNELTQKAIAKECAGWIRQKAKFKSNRADSPMQQFACVENESALTTYLPLHGFTAVDLGYQKGNAISNFINKIDDAKHSRMYLNLFEQIWQDHEKVEDITEKICEHIESVYNDNPPEYIYFVILYNIFTEFLEDISEDVLPNDLTGYQDSLIWKKLFNFQRDAAIGIINKLESYNGCILADSVGLGKTFTALAVIKYYELRNKSVLILCPKRMTDNWFNYNQNLVTNIFAKDRFNYTVLCHTDLQRDKGYSLGIPLDRINWGNFDLVVIDESHNFRNNEVYKDRETRYQKLMNRVIKTGVRTKVLMLSATPVNNRFNDLKNQLALSYEGDPANLNKKLRTEKDINEIFRKAQGVFNTWSKLPPEERTPSAILNALDFDFFELLDSVTIARSRKHIQKFYDTKDIGPFPNRKKPLSFHCPLTNRTDVIHFNDIFNQLITLKMAIYAPFRYILASRLSKYEEMYDTKVKGGFSRLKQSDRERSLQALMTVNLLKRLESSVEAFRLTLQSLQNNLERTLEKIGRFKKTGVSDSFDDITAALENAETDVDDLPDFEDATIGGKVQINLADMDLESWEFDLRADLDIMQHLLVEMRKITPSEDAKLQCLKELIHSKLKEPINPGNRKILIFTAFADTANYLYENLGCYLHDTYNIHTAKVTGSDGCKTTLKRKYDFHSILVLFSPISNEKAVILPMVPDEVDILIGTDCISEGQNLQDCDYMVNYDIHWNPVRIIQRFGRIDRIGSKNTHIQLVNFWPDISLDDYINLKERVENRMVIADVTATGDDNMLSAEANDLAFRKEQLQRLQDEVIDLDDVKTGVSITDLGLNDFRMDLVRYVKENGSFENTPKGMHAVIDAQPDTGLLPGVIFVLRNTDSSVNLNRQNRLHPYYLVYIDNNGNVLINHLEVKKILDLLRSACKNRPEPMKSLYQAFNRETQDGRKMDTYSRLLKQGIHSIIDVNEQKDIESLFSGGGTSALLNTISGLDNFELIAFLVIREEG
ncbi:MAG: helicase-related protein [Candidatus Loosdrechtia sp.]|uniref:helicase-related protein n=1 Tax=Candidatus Loosdrechtia sp. TaxID=3101272 RepID=UPI003A79E6B0|nr:MAG: helicase-related protein [Candidatus Jettenia sp. AMX2]